MLFMPLSVLHKQNPIENLKVQPIFSKFYFYWHQIAFIVIGFNIKEAMGSIVCKIRSNDSWKFLSFCGIQVDLVEPVSHFLETARENLVPESGTGPDTHKAVNFYCVPLQVNNVFF